MFEQAKEDVYDYVGRLVRCHSPDRAVEAFDALLLSCVTPLEPEIRGSLIKVIHHDRFMQEAGMHFINRLYYTLCNPLHLDIETTPYLRQIIGRLDNLPDQEPVGRATKKLRRRLREFSASEYGDCLRRQMRLCAQGNYGPGAPAPRRMVGDYLPDYFCLYQPVTRTPDIEELERNSPYQNPENSGVYAKQVYKLRQTYEAVYAYRAGRLRGDTGLVNPTRMADAVFERGLTQYYPHRSGSYQSQGRTLDLQRQPNQRYARYHAQVRDYVMAVVESFPGRTREKLGIAMVNSLAQIDDQATLVDPTWISLFTRLLDGVFLPEANASEMLRLRRHIDTATPLGFAGLLLSFVLACPMIRFELGKKLGTLYRYFENYRTEAADWVLDFFDHMNLALVMNATRVGYCSLNDPLPEVG